MIPKRPIPERCKQFCVRIVILLEKSLKVGDFIELSTGVVGEVKEVYIPSAT